MELHRSSLANCSRPQPAKSIHDQSRINGTVYINLLFIFVQLPFVFPMTLDHRFTNNSWELLAAANMQHQNQSLVSFANVHLLWNLIFSSSSNELLFGIRTLGIPELFLPGFEVNTSRFVLRQRSINVGVEKPAGSPSLATTCRSSKPPICQPENHGFHKSEVSWLKLKNSVYIIKKKHV